jgi:hypothetical protein
MRVFDCFTFSNELDLLELRLRELDSVVDIFVLVEANSTHSSLPKSWIFEENKERFSQWLHKIRHIKVDDMPMDPDAWINENFQRNAIARGLTDVNPDDRIFVSDCDEIVRSSAVEYIKNSNSEKWCLQMPLYLYKLNYQLITRGEEMTDWGMAMRGDQLPSTTPQLLRDQRHRPMPANVEVVPHGGWHFSWQGDKEFLRNKLISYAHTEHKTEASMADDPNTFFEKRLGGTVYSKHTFEIVTVSEYFPKPLQNSTFLSDRILPNATRDSREFLPPWTY